MSYIERARKLRDPYKILFDKTVARINQFWNNDIHRYMNERCPDLEQQINESEKQLDLLWEGKPLNDFKQELVKFYNLHERVYKQFLKAS